MLRINPRNKDKKINAPLIFLVLFLFWNFKRAILLIFIMTQNSKKSKESLI